MKIPNTSPKVANPVLFSLALLVACYAPESLGVLDNATPTIQVIVEVDERWGRMLSDDEWDLLAAKVKIEAVEFTITNGVVSETVKVAAQACYITADGGHRYLVSNVTLPALSAGTHALRWRASLGGAVTFPADATTGSPKVVIPVDSSIAGSVLATTWITSTAH